MNKYSKKIFIICSIIVCVSLMSIAVHAWYSFSFSSQVSINFTSNPEEHLELLIARIDNTSYLNNPDTLHEFDENIFVRPEQYIIKENRYDNDTYYYPQFTTDKFTTTRPKVADTYVIDNYTFGMVDDLVDPKPENIVYLRLKIDKLRGTELCFSLHYMKKDYIHFYQYTELNNNVTITDWPTAEQDATAAEILNQIKKIEIPETTPVCSFIQYQYYLSDTLYANGEAIETAIKDDTTNSIKWSKTVNFYQYGFSDKNYISLDIPSSSEVNNPDLVEEPCYLYIKITPNLDAYTELINIAGAYSTIYMDFDIKMEFEIRDNAA